MRWLVFLVFFFGKKRIKKRERKTLYERGGDTIEKIFEKLQNIKEEEYDYFDLKGKKFYARLGDVYDDFTFTVLFFYNQYVIKYRCQMNGLEPILEEKEDDIIREEKKNKFIELLHKHPTGLIQIECLEFNTEGYLKVNVWNMIDDRPIYMILFDKEKED